MSAFDISDWYNTTLIVYQRHKSGDSVGGADESSAAVTGELPCRIRQLTGDDPELAGEKNTRTTHRVYLDLISGLTLVPHTHFFTSAAGVEFDIVRVNNPHGEDAFLQVDCEVVGG